MPVASVSLAILFGAITALITLVLVLRMRWGEPSTRTRRSLSEIQGDLSFLFEGDQLIDMSEGGADLLLASGNSADWDGVLNLFRKRFALEDDQFGAAGEDGSHYVAPLDPDDPAMLTFTRIGSKKRLDLSSRDGDVALSGQQYYTLVKEVERLRSASDASPFPIWQVDANSEVAWHNKAYERIYTTVYDHAPRAGRPLFRINEPPLADKSRRRIPITPLNSKQTIWYDIQKSDVPSGDFFSAVDANAVVHAEAAQRNFVQTLAKTFAQLSIGLAIFDENRQLVLFNPAVIDLTGLGADFLSSRPNLLSFFDELRNKRLMPEPKNYNSWRQQIADLVAAAADGRYSETWTLDSGRTYRVNGRPHPDGAIAFLIEDISAEVSLTRRFRAELELGQSVLDSLGSAIAVFNSGGVLTITNETYRTLWGVDPDNSFAETSVIDCMRVWQGLSAASPVWGELRDFVLDFGNRSAWSDEVEMNDGTRLIVNAIPLVSSATMIQFQRRAFDPTRAKKRKARMEREA